MDQDAIINVVNDESIPEKDRIYSPNKKYWCKKTTKESADLLFENIEQMKKDIKQRGLKPAVPPKDEWHIINTNVLPLKTYPNIRIDEHYVFDDTKGIYQTYADDTRYGKCKEIIFDNEKQRFTIKDLNKLRKKWNDTHKDKVKQDIDRCFDEFCKEKF